eukprot:scaffold1736_cov127-Cylindrotheca_fusiformis.AAC.20
MAVANATISAPVGRPTKYRRSESNSNSCVPDYESQSQQSKKENSSRCHEIQTSTLFLFLLPRSTLAAKKTLSKATAIHTMGRILSIIQILLVLESNSEAFVPQNYNRKADRRLSSLADSSRNIVELGDSNFRDLFQSDTPVLIDACAKWCGPCKLIEPVINQCADDREDSLVVCRYDVDSDSNEVKLELLLQRVMPQALPSLILIRNRKVLGTRNGIVTDSELDEFLNQHLSKTTDVSEKDEIEETSKRIERRGFINFMNQVDDYMLTDGHL